MCVCVFVCVCVCVCSTCESTVPESDETLCLRCECRYESRNVALVAVSYAILCYI